MLESNSALYEAYKAKDARFDGCFFVGISSTGIYCRPVCRAKQPKAENCSFYSTAAQAEQAGHRPCLLCRPEQAPGFSVTDATAGLVYRAARMLETHCSSGHSLAEIAAHLGCTDRHLRRVFKAEYSVSPVQYLQTCRLLLAKNLLTDTDLSVLDVAMAAGFGSLRRFNDLFQKQYRLSPTTLRRQMPREAGYSGNITLALGYRPPYRWEDILRFLAVRTITGVDMVRSGEYLRTAQFVTDTGRRVYGWVQVGHRPQKNALAVTISESLLPVLPQVLARVRHLFDLYCEPRTVYETLQKMDAVRPGLAVPGIRVPGCFDAFEMMVRAVLGQHITARVASTLAARVARTYGIPVDTGIEGLSHVFPAPEEILSPKGSIERRLGSLGVIAEHAGIIHELARSLAEKSIQLDNCTQPEEEVQRLTAIQGVDCCTAGYIAMRAFGWPDVFLGTDAGVMKALQPLSPKESQRIAEAWRPWRSYATVNLWNSL